MKATAHGSPDAGTTHRPMIGVGEVRHARLRPRHHAFSYATYFLLLPMRSRAQGHAIAGLPQRGAWLTFDDRDHGDGRPDALAWMLELLQSEGVSDADGEIWLQAYPRVLGYVFKPVSFWYCHRADGSLRAVVAEVNNTFGERHCYILDGRDVRFGQTLQAQKVFHVSPFCATSGHYRFRFMRTDARIVARVEHDDAHGPLIITSLSGTLEPLTQASARRAFFSAPLMTLAVVARIHWHAVQLWFKRVPFYGKPSPPPTPVSR